MVLKTQSSGSPAPSRTEIGLKQNFSLFHSDSVLTDFTPLSKDYSKHFSVDIVVYRLDIYIVVFRLENAALDHL